MPPIVIVRTFAIVWWTLGITLLSLSVVTFVHAIGADADGSSHVAVLAGIEAISALLFLIPRSQRIGAVGLILTLLSAFALHAVRSEYRWDLVVYTVTVIFVAVHGPVPLAWLRQVRSAVSASFHTEAENQEDAVA